MKTSGCSNHHSDGEEPPSHAPIQTVDPILAWVLAHLPALNAQVYQGQMSAHDMANRVNHTVLNRLPVPVTKFIPIEFRTQLLVLLGMLGSSVERHVQQEFVKAELARVERGDKQQPDPVIPGQGLDLLQVGISQTFVGYFQQLAASLNHPYRDSFTTFVVFNGPALKVRHPVSGEVLCAIPAVLSGGRYGTFTGQRAEVEFIRLLKKSFALQKAANLFLEELQEPTTDLSTPAAIASAFAATVLIDAIYAELLAFMRLSAFSVDFFLDYLRQYACLWYADHDLRPPSGANDYASIQRDLILFDELFPARGGCPGYHQYARDVCSILMPHEIAKLEVAMAQTSLESKILQHLDLNHTQFEQLTRKDMLQMLTTQPWLVAYCQLYIAQKRLSHLHYSSVRKYLIQPKKVRDKRGDRRESITVVSNHYGTTGMDPLGIVKLLDQARAHHPLARLEDHEQARIHIEHLSRQFGYQSLPPDQLLDLCT